MNGDISLQQIERYLLDVEELAEQVTHIRDRLRSQLADFRENPQNVRNVADLQSTVAYIEKFATPFALSQQIIDQPIIENTGRLTIGIDGMWRAFEFRQMFDSFDYLNKLFTLQAKIDGRVPDFRVRQQMTRADVYINARLYYYLATREELRVRRVEFASPGLVSFEGVGEVIREVRETFDYIITWEFLKRMILNFHIIHDRQLRNIEREAQFAEARARIARANAERAQANLQLEETNFRRALERSVIRQALSQTRQEVGDRGDSFERGVRAVNRIAEIAARLEARDLANQDLVEETAIGSLSKLRQLTDEGKINARSSTISHQ